MKAIQQIIEYFRSRGILDDEALAQLTAAGFLQVKESADSEIVTKPKKLHPVRRERTDEVRRDELIEAAETTALTPRPSRASRGGKDVLHKGKVLDGEELRGLLAARMGGWDDRLDGLTRLASHLGCSGDWMKAALAIRGAEKSALEAVVVDALERREPALNDLWTALELEEYRQVSEGARGPVVSAYDKLLSSPEALPASRYRWVLAIDEVAAIGHLREAQRRVLRALGTVFTERPELIARSVSRDYCPGAYWAMVIVFTARRGVPGHRPPPSESEHFPTRPPLVNGDRLRAWALAVTIDSRAVPPLLIEHDRVFSENDRIAMKYRDVNVDELDAFIHRVWEAELKSGRITCRPLKEHFQEMIERLIKPRVKSFYDVPGELRFFPEFATPPTDILGDWFEAGRDSLAGVNWTGYNWTKRPMPEHPFNPAQKERHYADLRQRLLNRLRFAMDHFGLLICPKVWDWNKG